MALALEAPGQVHAGGHLYAIDNGGAGFVYLVDETTGKLTHLYPSVLGSGAAYYPKTGLWYSARNIGAAADDLNVFWTLYASFNSNAQMQRTVRMVQATTYTGNSQMAYNSADGHFYLLQNGQDGSVYFEKIDPSSGQSLGRTGELPGGIGANGVPGGVGKDGLSAITGFAFDSQGHLWAIVLKTMINRNGGPSETTYELDEFDLNSGLWLYEAGTGDVSGHPSGLAYDPQKHLLYTYFSTPIGDFKFGTIDMMTGVFRPIASVPTTFALQWGP